MKHRGILLTLSILLAVGGSAASDPAPRVVTVNGHAEIRVVPDEVILALGVETFDPDLATAKAHNDERMSAVIEAAESLDIAREHIATEHVGIEPIYRYESARREFLHYQVRKTVTITLRDVDRFEALLSAVLEAGANHVHGVEFRTTELRKHRDRARGLAMVAAKEKAEDLARELGESVGRVRSIQEGYTPWWSSYGSWWGRRGGGMTQNVIQTAGPGGGGTAGPTTPGQIAIDARVTVSFELKE